METGWQVAPHHCQVVVPGPPVFVPAAVRVFPTCGVPSIVTAVMLGGLGGGGGGGAAATGSVRADSDDSPSAVTLTFSWRPSSVASIVYSSLSVPTGVHVSALLQLNHSHVPLLPSAFTVWPTCNVPVMVGVGGGSAASASAARTRLPVSTALRTAPNLLRARWGDGVVRIVPTFLEDGEASIGRGKRAHELLRRIWTNDR